MNSLVLLAPLLHALWYLIPLVVIGLVFKSPWFKGVLGEFMINSSIKNNLNPEKYHLLKNVTIPSDGGTTQIDHVLVCEFGIFVLETKNMKGWIFGNERQKSWTQKIYKHTTKFQNPLHQNYKHVKTLQQLLGLANEQMHSLVIFVGDCTFKTEMPENVTKGKAFLKFIRSKIDIVFSEQAVKDLVLRIEEGRLEPSLKTHFEHVKNVKQIVSHKQNNEILSRKPIASVLPERADSTDALEGKFCPKCSHAMILRVAKKGGNVGKKFWGCSQYPKCRFVVDI